MSHTNIIEITAPGKPSCLETGEGNESRTDIKTFTNNSGNKIKRDFLNSISFSNKQTQN